jgi:hypothetical protein
MSNLKFFFLYELIPARRTICFCSMKLANQTMALIIIGINTLGFILDTQNTQDSIVYSLFKFLIYSSLNFISAYFIFKSTTRITYKEAYLGHLFLLWCLLLHYFIFSINLIFSIKFFPGGGFINSLNEQMSFNKILLFFNSIIPQIFYLILEFIFYWMCYLYTKNLSLGKDALVDGQSFDRYVENLASSEKSSERNNISLSNLNVNLNLNDSLQ